MVVPSPFVNEHVLVHTTSKMIVKVVQSERPVAFEDEGKGVGPCTVFTHWAFGCPAGLVCKLVSQW